MRRLSENMLVMSAVMAVWEREQLGEGLASGKFLGGAGEMSQADKCRARLSEVAAEVTCRSMKAIVPCLVLGSSVLSMAALFVVSYILLG